MAGAAFAVLCLALWLGLGQNQGWTKTTRTHMEKDAVTDLLYPVIEIHFSPGVDFLAAGLLLSAALAGISFAFKTKPKP